ncbi:AlpA family phage regulatory protein [Shewanella sp. NIFS-20-20]|uniref:AlpA family phage regulatory protein n=1 Tax=Shewanella sp. NIFS-20-20 TaxID=2853806 RepID=UPI001C47E166|nr:AlpA family phage regulatory protein [Shewanella sp. NIFS-20-20]MBV7317349.1 AlpA family transcriptional regulator [Shewanella sp. NIFS-20-20]
MKHIDLTSIDIQAANDLVFDRLVKEKERQLITGISKAQAFQLERLGEFPRRRRISNRSVAWLLSELLDWIAAREVVISPTEAKE